jgi:hypothetical protein
VTDTGPRVGPCSPWINEGDVLALSYPDDLTVDPAIAAMMASAASNVLYALSGRVFTGACGPVTVRPIQRPTDVDTRFGGRGLPNGMITAGQYGSAYGSPYSAAVCNYGSSKPPEVDLGVFPVIAVSEVKIDGVVIPPNEYALQDSRTLVRIMPTAGSAPTQRYGWPVAARTDLPDTEPGTFSVTYTYGTPPGDDGILAVKTLARQLVLNYYDQDNVLPQRVTSMTRQGVSVAITDVMDFFARGLSGLYEVDLFIETVNPTKRKMKPMAWSPDVGRPRRVTY